MAAAASPFTALTPARRRVVQSLIALSCAAVAVVVAHDEFNVGSDRFDAFVTNWIQSNVFLLVGAICLLRVAWASEERSTWLALGIGILCWWPANTTFHFWVVHQDPMPFPSISDAFWLASYPFLYLGIVLAARRHLSGVRIGLWLDGVLRAPALGALTAAVVLQAVLGSLGGPFWAVLTNLAYPLADVVLLGLIGGIFVLAGWRPGRRWRLIAAGMALLFAADSVYLVEVAIGVYQPGNAVEALWPVAFLLPALAAWQPVDEGRRLSAEGSHLLALPSLFILIGAGVLVADHFLSQNLVAIALAGATILAAMLRSVLTLREVRALADSRRLAETD